MKDITLDTIRLGRSARQQDLTRYQQIEEERLNRNFRLLQEEIERLSALVEELSARVNG